MAVPVFPWGKYQGRKIKFMTSVEEAKYLHWVVGSKFWPKMKKEIKDEIKLRLNIK
jgi:uncharacterized protein (DUF3820 family)